MDVGPLDSQLKPAWEPLETISFEPGTCCLCGKQEGALRFQKVIRDMAMHYYSCADCGILYAHPRADRMSLQKLYSSKDFFEGGAPGSDHLNYHQFVSGENYLRATAKDRLQRILAHQAGGQLLEIASAAGFFLIEAKLAGFEVQGIEISRPLAGYAQKKWQVPVLCQSAEEADFGVNSREVVVSWGVMTILRNPKGFIQKVYDALKPGGLWAFNTYYHEGFWPRVTGARWDILTVNMNQIFSRRTVCHLASAQGFRLVSMRREMPYTDFEKLADKAEQITGLQGIGKWTARLGLSKKVIRLPLPDVMEYVWQKG